MSKIKILYVEDELSLGKIVKESLETRDFEVIMENDGAKVIECFSKVQPEVCILDIMLPNRDGFTIAEQIRNINKNIPIIFLTAKTQTQDVVKGFKLGGNDYIRKPFSMEELIVRIHNVLRLKTEHPSADLIKMGIYQFHPGRQLLTNGKEECKLSYRECELLKILYEHNNTIIERKDILNKLWGNDSFLNSRNLDVYITKLRNYLKQDTSIEIITIKGVGYRFMAE